MRFVVLINGCLMHGEHGELRGQYYKFITDVHAIKRLWNVHHA